MPRGGMSRASTAVVTIPAPSSFYRKKPLEIKRNIWIDYLRSFITVLVVAHHSSLAYTTFASFDKNAYINSTHPIVDTKRWIGLDVFENFNDIFFMSLMFLIGGLFLSKSLAKKGAVRFLLDRTFRLFIPFLFLGTIFMLIAYFPAYNVAHESTDVVAYIKDFFTTEKWPVGPPWFIWVLFLFNCLFVFISPIIRKIKPRANLAVDNLQGRPVLLFFGLLLFTWLLYVPVAYNIGAGTWTGWLPFDFQLSRILLYFGYFMIGVLTGGTDFNNRIFSLRSNIVKNWWIWAILALIVYTALTMGAGKLEEAVKNNHLKEFDALMIYFTIYVSSCVLSCLAFITVFRKFAVHKVNWWSSLSDNAYLIYLIHYIFVIWTQFSLMEYDLPAFVKFLITFICALSLSWAISNLMRKNKLVRRYL